MNPIVRHDPFDDFLRGFFVRQVEFDQRRVAADLPAMRLDVAETNGGYKVHAELPGMRKEDIHVAVDGSVVTVSAERRRETETGEAGKILRSERHFGKVSRSFQLPEEVDEARANAKFSDGVLVLTLPKKSPPPAKRLAID